jgi:pimeloyl-ACP methyl ester carboxylesterase
MSIMETDKRNETITLKDGRTLAYAEWGDPAGKPVFHFHGSSSSRLERPPDEKMLAGIRLITIDRPGHGLSDFKPGYRLLDWPNDVIALADHLGLDKFAVEGWSFGGPYAMACAFKLPGRVHAAGLISSFAPYDRPNSTEGMARFNKIALGMVHRTPWLGKPFMRMQGRMMRGDPERLAKQLLSSVPESDKKLLEQPETVGVLLESIQESFRISSEGAAWEAIMLVRPWGFRLEEIVIPVNIWHGEDDVNDPLQCGEYLRDKIPNARATFFPGEGHFLILKRWGDILVQLVSEPLRNESEPIGP